MKISKCVLVLTLVLGTGVSFLSFADMSPRERLISERIAPVGDVYLDGQQPAPAAAGGEALSPEGLYNKYCSLCHKVGVSGAPILGNKDAWAPRVAAGMSQLVDHALHGFKAMPPKGTCMSCSDDEIKAVVEYMVSKSK